MSYSVEHIAESRGASGSYRYMIFRDGHEFAIFWHDYRGDCEGIKLLLSGREVDPPFGRCSEFLTGCGPHSLGLSEKAVCYLNS